MHIIKVKKILVIWIIWISWFYQFPYEYIWVRVTLLWQPWLRGLHCCNMWAVLQVS